MTPTTARKPVRTKLEKPDYYIGRFTKGSWVRVVPNEDRTVLRLEWPKSVKPYGERPGAA